MEKHVEPQKGSQFLRPRCKHPCRLKLSIKPAHLETTSTVLTHWAATRGKSRELCLQDGHLRLNGYVRLIGKAGALLLLFYIFLLLPGIILRVLFFYVFYAAGFWRAGKGEQL